MPAEATPPTFADVTAASERLRGVATRTPLEHSAWLSDVAGVPVFLKVEAWQRTRSFKMRGAYNAISTLSASERDTGLVTASAGNHGQAVSLAASLLGARATVFVPAGTPVVKKDRIRSYGATLDDSTDSYDDAEIAAMEFARARGQYFVHAFSDPNVVAGQGTVAVEIIEEIPDVAAVVVPVGGGGLATGTGIALRALAPNAQLIGVQSSETRAMYDAFAAGRIVDSPITPTIADGLAGCTDATAYRWLRMLTDSIHLVPEASLRASIRKLFEATGIVSEGAGIVGVAAILENSIQLTGPTVVVLSGGNINPAFLSEILAT